MDCVHDIEGASFMAHFDRYGLPISTTSDLAAEKYRAGVDLLLSLWPGAAETLDATIAADPEFALAHAARARLHAIGAEVLAAVRKRVYSAVRGALFGGHGRQVADA
jgi:hypothetical protein